MGDPVAAPPAGNGAGRVAHPWLGDRMGECVGDRVGYGAGGRVLVRR